MKLLGAFRDCVAVLLQDMGFTYKKADPDVWMKTITKRPMEPSSTVTLGTCKQYHLPQCKSKACDDAL